MAKLIIWVGSIGFEGETPIDLLCTIYNSFDKKNQEHHYPIFLENIKKNLFSKHFSKDEAKELYNKCLESGHPYHETHALAFLQWYAKYGEEPSNQIRMELE